MIADLLDFNHNTIGFPENYTYLRLALPYYADGLLR